MKIALLARCSVIPISTVPASASNLASSLLATPAQVRLRYHVKRLTKKRATVILEAIMVCRSFSRELWLLMTLLVLSSGSASAEWLALESQYQSPGLQTVYIDPATIRREGGLVTLWQLTDYTLMQGGRKSTRFLSTTTHKQFDCANKRLRLLAFTTFYGHMGTGRPANGYVDSGTWLPLEPESVNYALWELACSKE